MSDDLISDQTRELPEVQLPVIVYFHADVDDEAELRSLMEQIRHHVQVALADEDNDLVGFVYPEVRLGKPEIHR